MALPNPLLLPNQRVPLAGAAQCTNEWYTALSLAVSYMQQAGVDPSVIADIQARLAELEEQGDSFLLQGLLSVQVFGTPENGLVALQLLGDEAAPGNTYYYGTGPTGTKGWFAVADAITATQDGIELVVGSDGVTDVVPDDDLAAVEALSGTGLAARTAADTWATRTITAGSGVTVSNGDGVAGNPTVAHADTSSVSNLTSDNSGVVVLQDIAFTFDTFGHVLTATVATVNVATALAGTFQPLDADLTAIAALAGTGFPTRTAANTWAQRSFPNGTGYTWTNPAGIAGDPTLVLNANLQAWSSVTTASKADLASPAFTGNPTAPTPSPGDSDTSLATTAFVSAAISTAGAGYQPLDATLTALAAQNWSANAMPLGTGADTVTQLALAANTFPGRSSAGNVVAKSITDGSLGVLAGSSGDGVFLRGDGTASSTLNAQLILTRPGSNGSMVVNGATSGTGEMTTGSTGGLLLRGTQATQAFIDIDPLPQDGTSAGSFRFFRATNTTGAAQFTIHLGDGSATSNHVIRGKGGPTVMCTNNGALVVGQALASGGAAILQANGVVAPTTDNTRDLGEASFRWAVVRAGTGTINTSDANEKDAVVPFAAEELAAAKVMASEIGTFHWLQSLIAKGADARTHIGLTVQRAMEVMEAHGLDPFRYGFICYDEWDEAPELWVHHPATEAEHDEDGNVTREAEPARDEKIQEFRAAGSRYSFRHDQLLLFIARGFEERLSALEALLNP